MEKDRDCASEEKRRGVTNRRLCAPYLVLQKCPHLTLSLGLEISPLSLDFLFCTNLWIVTNWEGRFASLSHLAGFGVVFEETISIQSRKGGTFTVTILVHISAEML